MYPQRGFSQRLRSARRIRSVLVKLSSAIFSTSRQVTFRYPDGSSANLLATISTYAHTHTTSICIGFSGRFCSVNCFTCTKAFLSIVGILHRLHCSPDYVLHLYPGSHLHNNVLQFASLGLGSGLRIFLVAFISNISFFRNSNVRLFVSGFFTFTVSLLTTLRTFRRRPFHILTSTFGQV